MLCLTLTLFSALPALAQARADAGQSAYVLNKEHSRFLFSISHFFVSSTEGRFTAFDGHLRFAPDAPEHGAVTIHVSPALIDTGIVARDDHLRSADFFDVAKFPLVTFEGTALVKTSDTAGKVTGTLTLHGVTRPLAVNVTLKTQDLSADRLGFSASATLKRSDFGMTNYLGVIGDEVTLTVDAEFDRER